jgi:predicted enzyme related to lactoylglutathione lyase
MGFTPVNFVCWAEIPVTDMEKGMAFYSAVTGADLELDTSGPNPMANLRPKDMMNGVGGHLYPGKPAAQGEGPTIHLMAEGKLEDVMERVTAAGGQVVSPPITIPPGRFFYAIDPFGNSVGFFEAR